jgi:hypothetical protein
VRTRQFGAVYGACARSSARRLTHAQVVTKEAYDNKLQSLNILVLARNFLVFQGDVEEIASRTPRELTDMFEKISGSAELIAEYNKLAAAKQEAEDNMIFTFQKKKVCVRGCVLAGVRPVTDSHLFRASTPRRSISKRRKMKPRNFNNWKRRRCLLMSSFARTHSPATGLRRTT